MIIKKINYGKQFEEDFIKSLPDYIFRLRLKDAGGWSNAENTRFTVSNPCDFIIQNRQLNLYMAELKTHKGKSIPYSAMKQLDKMIEYQNKYEYINCIFIINFRDLNKTFIINVLRLDLIRSDTDRKSFAYDDIKEWGVLIPQKLKRIRYKYDLEEYFEQEEIC